MSLLSSLVPSFNRAPAPAAAPVAEQDLDPKVKPTFNIAETSEGFALTVYLPGVDHAGLELQTDAETLTITGRRAWKKPGEWTSLYREIDNAPFQLVLSHPNAFDLDKIQAELRDGVLHVALAKANAIKPRKITVS